MKKLIFCAIATAALVLMVGCTDEPVARRVLEDQGYTEIHFTGYRWMTCGDDYTYHTGFAAKSVVGRPVSGAVCSGFFKGNAIKTD